MLALASFAACSPSNTASDSACLKSNLADCRSDANKSNENSVDSNLSLENFQDRKKNTLPVAAGETDGISLARTTIRAIYHNPTINIARWQFSTASRQTKIAKSKRNPRAEYYVAGGGEITVNSTGDAERHDRRNLSLSASQPIADFGKTTAEVERAERLALSAQKLLENKIEQTVASIVDIYLTILEQDHLIANSRDSEAAHRKTLNLVKLNAKAGNATQADVEQAFTRLENAKTQTINFISARQRNSSEFRRIAGIEPSSLELPTPLVRSHIDLNNIDQYLNRNPLLQSVILDGESLQLQQKSIKRSYLPEIGLEGIASTKKNSGARHFWLQDARALLYARGSLFDGGEKKAKSSQIEARYYENSSRYYKSKNDIEFEIRDIVRIMEAAYIKEESIQERIRASEKVVSLYLQQFSSAGNRGIFELLDAQQELFAARFELINNRFDALKAQYSANRYAGTLLQSIIGDKANELFAQQ